MTLAEDRGIDLDVYEPAEDSWLLGSTVVERVTGTDRVLDVGTGSGYVAALIRRDTGACVIGADINPHACRRARMAGIPVVRCDLCDPFVRNGFDVVVFNPPYLPAPPRERGDSWFEIAIAGGETGRDVIESFLASVGRVLTPTGTVFLLVSSLTGITDVIAYATDQGFTASEIGAESYPGERLVILALEK